MTHCYACDNLLQTRREDRELTLGGRTVGVEHEFLWCPACGEEYLLPEQMAAIQRRAAARVREVEGLLQPAEIRAIRAELDLSQEQFERLLGIGSKTVVRWERGTVFQSKAADNLMRLVRQVPGAADYLARRNGVALSGKLAAVLARTPLPKLMDTIAITPYLSFHGTELDAEVRIQLEPGPAMVPEPAEIEHVPWQHSEPATIRVPTPWGSYAPCA